jgi:hypothetical protein
MSPLDARKGIKDKNLSNALYTFMTYNKEKTVTRPSYICRLRSTETIDIRASVLINISDFRNLKKSRFKLTVSASLAFRLRDSRKM